MQAAPLHAQAKLRPRQSQQAAKRRPRRAKHVGSALARKIQHQADTKESVGQSGYSQISVPCSQNARVRRENPYPQGREDCEQNTYQLGAHEGDRACNPRDAIPPGYVSSTGRHAHESDDATSQHRKGGV